MLVQWRRSMKVGRLIWYYWQCIGSVQYWQCIGSVQSKNEKMCENDSILAVSDIVRYRQYIDRFRTEDRNRQYYRSIKRNLNTADTRWVF